jgi:ankyrin repeat protein
MTDNDNDSDAQWWSAIRTGNPKRVLALLSRRGGTAEISSSLLPSTTTVAHTLPGPFPKVLRGRKKDLRFIDHRFGFGQDRFAQRDQQLTVSSSSAVVQPYFWLPGGVDAVKIRTQETAAHICCARGFSEVLLLLIEENCDLRKKTNAGSTLLHLAAKNGHAEAVGIVLDALGSVDAADAAQYRNGAGETPIAIASRCGHFACLDLLCHAVSKRPNAMEAMDAKNHAGETALELAARCGFEKCVAVLLEHGVAPHGHPTRRTAHGHVVSNPDPLLLSVRGKASNPNIVALLRNAGAKVKHSHLYETARAHARSPSKRDRLLPPLTDPGLNDVVGSDDVNDEMSVLSIQFKAEEASSMKIAIQTALTSNRPDVAYALLNQVIKTSSDSLTDIVARQALENGSTLLHLASASGHASAIQQLLSMNAEVDCKATLTGNTALHASSNDVCTEMLIKAGADVMAANKEAAIPLHYACRRGDLQSVRLFLDENAQMINVRDHSGITPLVEAIRCAPQMEHACDLAPSTDSNKKQEMFNVESLERAQTYQQHLEVAHELVSLDTFCRGPFDTLKDIIRQREAQIQVLVNSAEVAAAKADQEKEEARLTEEELKKSSFAVLELLSQLLSQKTFKKDLATTCVESYIQKMTVKQEQQQQELLRNQKAELDKKPSSLGEKEAAAVKPALWPGITELSAGAVFVEKTIIPNQNSKKKPKQKSKSKIQKEKMEKCLVAMENACQRLRLLLDC